MWDGLPANNQEVKIMYIGGWKKSERYGIIRANFEDAGIRSAWIREMAWVDRQVLQMIVREDHVEEIKEIVRGRGTQLLVDEKFDWAKAIEKKDMKSLKSMVRGIKKQLARPTGMSPEVRKILVGQIRQAEGHTKSSEECETSNAEEEIKETEW